MKFSELDISAYLKGQRHDYYKQTVDEATDMSVHIHGNKPIKLLNRVRPREDPEVKKYRLESYEPITTATADKAIVTVQKIMNPKLWTIKFDKSAQELEQYLFKNYPFYGNVMTYVNDVIIRGMLADPNGIVCVIPLAMDIPDNEKVKPVTTIIGSEQLWDYDFGKWYLVHESKEKSGNEEIDFFYWFDQTEVVRFKTVKTVDKLFVYTISIYQHNIGEPPVWFLSGLICKFDYKAVLYRSFFSAA